jgi:hypothetical protein
LHDKKQLLIQQQEQKRQLQQQQKEWNYQWELHNRQLMLRQQTVQQNGEPIQNFFPIDQIRPAAFPPTLSNAAPITYVEKRPNYDGGKWTPAIQTLDNNLQPYF